MDIRITGASGYLGKIITRELEQRGHQWTAVERRLLYGPAAYLKAELKNADALVHLAGAPILKRWTAKNRKKIYDSRVVTTQNLMAALRKMPPGERPRKVCSASAIGIYSPWKMHDEASTAFDTTFLGKVVQDWESAWKGLPKGMHLNIFRIGLVLGRTAAITKKLWWPFKLGVGGRIGTGKQPFPFVHEKDVARAFVWALENPEPEGVYNLVAPQAITNADFTRGFARKMHRPAFIPVPAFALKVVFGKAAAMLLESPEVKPKALLDARFDFRYPDLEAALEELFASQAE